MAMWTVCDYVHLKPDLGGNLSKEWGPNYCTIATSELLFAISGTYLIVFGYYDLNARVDDLLRTGSCSDLCRRHSKSRGEP